MAARTRLFAALGLIGGALGAAAACGLPLGGLGAAGDAGASDATATGDDASGTDETGIEASVPPGCTTLDAACLGTLPPGWQPVSVTDGGCGAGFDAATLLANAQSSASSCACGACQVVGAFACNGAVTVTSGDGCNDTPAYIASAVPDTCLSAPNGGAQHVEAHPPIAAGNVGCFVPNDAGTGVTTDPLTVCIPGCTADFCGASPRCIVSEGSIPCPAGFTLLTQAGTGADPGCPPCPCEAGAPGPCGGTVTVYGAASCTDAGGSATYAVDTCNQFSTSDNFTSLIVDLVPPEASCSASSTPPGPGDASLLGVRTICCQ